MSEGWSIYVIALTFITLIGIVWVLFANRYSSGQHDADSEAHAQQSGPTTGHSHDGIEEFDNPLPAWWFYCFVITIIFGVGYLIAYPGMGNFPGLLNWRSVDQWEQQQQRAEKKYAAVFAAYRDQSVESLAGQPAALKMGQRIFANNCAQCHGTDARGSLGFPNLTDNDWLYGGGVDQIRHSILKGRSGIMPAWGAALGEQGSRDTVAYILQLSAEKEPSADKQLAAQLDRGKQAYQSFCIACHGAEGKGNPALGAPDLTDDIWLYGSDTEAITHSIVSGRNGVMPAHENKINRDKVHLLTAYVYSLSRSQQ